MRAGVCRGVRGARSPVLIVHSEAIDRLHELLEQRVDVPFRRHGPYVPYGPGASGARSTRRFAIRGAACAPRGHLAPARRHRARLSRARDRRRRGGAAVRRARPRAARCASTAPAGVGMSWSCRAAARCAARTPERPAAPAASAREERHLSRRAPHALGAVPSANAYLDETAYCYVATGLHARSLPSDERTSSSSGRSCRGDVLRTALDGEITESFSKVAILQHALAGR